MVWKTIERRFREEKSSKLKAACSNCLYDAPSTRLQFRLLEVVLPAQQPLLAPTVLNMSVSICTQCFARLRPTHKTSAAFSRAFSTTTSQAGSPSGRKVRHSKAGYRESTNHKAAKKKTRVVPKLPLVGERKALRKRIVLSNTNALEIQGMQDLNVRNMTDESQIGKVLGLNSEVLDHLREVKAFKPTQNWNMFRKPGTLIRRESVELGRSFLDVMADDEGKQPRTIRRIIAGERSTGKSLMLLQAMSMAFMNQWVVIHVPEGSSHSSL